MVLAEHRHGATAHEDVELRELHLLRLVDVARRTHHQEEHLAVPLELRPLPGMHEVFDEQRVQLPRLREMLDLVVGRGGIEEHRHAFGGCLGERQCIGDRRAGGGRGIHTVDHVTREVRRGARHGLIGRTPPTAATRRIEKAVPAGIGAGTAHLDLPLRARTGTCPSLCRDGAWRRAGVRGGARASPL